MEPEEIIYEHREQGRMAPGAASSGSIMENNKQTEVEEIAERIEKRRAQRVPVTYNARVRFLKYCRKIKKSRSSKHPRISKQDVLVYRDIVMEESDSSEDSYTKSFRRALGIKSDIECLAQILDRAIQVLESNSFDTGEWLYYNDFSFDHTHVVSRWPLMRSELGKAAMLVVLHYLFTSLLFCVIMPCRICEAESKWMGVVSSWYFASVTMSTVGYGDLTVEQDPRYQALVGALYMLLSIVVSVVAFSAAASATFSPLENMLLSIFARFHPKKDKDLFLHERIRKIKFVKLAGLTVEIVAFIMLGTCASQLSIYLYDPPPEEGANWTWMTSFYWAVQTATTIGYGDVVQDERSRYFNVVYLMIGTVLVGNALGKLRTLKQELAAVRRRHAWETRPVTKRMIDEMQAYVHDDSVNEYEFLVASLVSMGQLSTEDIAPIMDKFKRLAGETGVISIGEDEDVDDDYRENESGTDPNESDTIDLENPLSPPCGRLLAVGNYSGSGSHRIIFENTLSSL